MRARWREEYRALNSGGWLLQWGYLRSHWSFAFASAFVCHCIFEGLSAPPEASGRT
jgi:hypothetical protein